MPVVTIKNPRRSRTRGQEALMARARAQCESLLCDADRVLVVYGTEAASIYYEGEGEPDGAPRPLPRAG